MIKRFIALALTIFFICFKCLTWVPTAAATGIPAFDAFYYAILQTLGMAYTNGVEMDLAPVIAEVRQAVPDYLQQPDVALKYFLREYAGKVWDSLSQTWIDAGNDSAYLNNVAAIRIAGNDVSTPTLRDLVSQYQKKALDISYEVTTPIDSNAIAFWNKYNSIEINNFLDKLNAVPEGTITPVLPTEYAYLDNTKDFIPFSSGVLNGYSFINSNLLVKFYQNQTVSLFDNIAKNEVTYVNPNNNNTFNNTQFYFSNPVTINVTTNLDNTVSVVYNNLSNITIYYNTVYYYGVSLWQNSVTAEDPFFRINSSITTPWNYNFSNSFTNISEACTYFNKRFRNFNLFVDGQCWLNISTPTTFNGSVPNAVIDTGTDDGKIVSNPIYWVVDNNTGLPIDSQINLDKLIDYLKGVIDGTNDDTSVDFGDLVDAGVIEKQDGTVIIDSDVIAIPVADVIDDAIADTDAIDTPIGAIGDIPPLPPLPPFFPTPDFPEGDPTSGFNGMSVLARIINITNQSLPSEVVLVFYGVVFGAVILGIIKILHK